MTGGSCHAAKMMHSLRNLALVGVCFASVCAAEARPAKWEYVVVSAALNNRNLEQMLNARGAEGWELITLTRKDVAILKRPAR
jgi:hypothetical protein